MALRIGDPIPAAKQRHPVHRHSLLPPSKSSANPRLAFALGLVAPIFLFGAALFFLLITLSSPVIIGIRLLTWITPTGPTHTDGEFSLGVLGACQEGFDRDRPICTKPHIGYEIKEDLGGQVDVEIIARGVTGALFLNPLAAAVAFLTFAALIIYYHTERWKRTTRALIHFSTLLSLSAIFVNLSVFTTVRDRINNPDLSLGGHRILGHAILGNAIWLSVAAFALVLPIEVVEVWRWGTEGGWKWLHEEWIYIVREEGWREIGIGSWRVGRLTKGGRGGQVRLRRAFVNVDGGRRSEGTDGNGSGRNPEVEWGRDEKTKSVGAFQLGQMGPTPKRKRTDDEESRVESFFDVGDTTDSPAPTRESGFRWVS